MIRYLLPCEGKFCHANLHAHSTDSNRQTDSTFTAAVNKNICRINNAGFLTIGNQWLRSAVFTKAAFPPDEKVEFITVTLTDSEGHRAVSQAYRM
ncbi:MAG: hypothetical protein IJF49_00715 [Clostridia bacterium]|nr:hypothetical protein [Clostridia bacterium]